MYLNRINAAPDGIVQGNPLAVVGTADVREVVVVGGGGRVVVGSVDGREGQWYIDTTDDCVLQLLLLGDVVAGVEEGGRVSTDESA